MVLLVKLVPKTRDEKIAIWAHVFAVWATSTTQTTSKIQEGWGLPITEALTQRYWEAAAVLILIIVGWNIWRPMKVKDALKLVQPRYVMVEGVLVLTKVDYLEPREGRLHSTAAALTPVSVGGQLIKSFSFYGTTFFIFMSANCLPILWVAILSFTLRPIFSWFWMIFKPFREPQYGWKWTLLATAISVAGAYVMFESNPNAAEGKDAATLWFGLEMQCCASLCTSFTASVNRWFENSGKKENHLTSAGWQLAVGCVACPVLFWYFEQPFMYSGFHYPEFNYAFLGEWNGVAAVSWFWVIRTIFLTSAVISPLLYLIEARAPTSVTQPWTIAQPPFAAVTDALRTWTVPPALYVVGLCIVLSTAIINLKVAAVQAEGKTRAQREAEEALKAAAAEKK